MKRPCEFKKGDTVYLPYSWGSFSEDGDTVIKATFEEYADLPYATGGPRYIVLGGGDRPSRISAPACYATRLGALMVTHANMKTDMEMIEDHREALLREIVEEVRKEGARLGARLDEKD